MRAYAASLLVVVLAGAFAGAVLASAPTKILVYSAFGPDGVLANGVRVDRSGSGSCWEGSVVNMRPDAWRCTVGNGIYDPCYSGPRGWVACPTTFGGGRVLRITLTKPLPRNTNRALNTQKADPLLIVLRGGVRCGFASGATSTVAGMRLNYACSNGSWLVGDPDRGQPTWRILSLASLRASHASPVPIVTAWF